VFGWAGAGLPAQAWWGGSSGTGVRDEAALRCVLGRAGRLPRVADCLSVPVVFRLGRQ